MSWIAVTFELDTARAEALGEALLESGALAVDVADGAAGTPRESPLFGEPGAPPAAGWECSRVTGLFSADADISTAAAAALSASGLAGDTARHIERVDDRDWVRATQEQFPPIRISQRLWVVPSWREPPDPQALNVVLDPGLAFGTGTHPTTRLALRWLEANVHGGETVIDYGCGSGILAIAALKLGAMQARGVDIDEQALIAARGNAMQNRVEARFAAADDPGGPAELVVANILANPLIVLAPVLAKSTARHGRLALSGILAGQADDVWAAYREWFDLMAIEHDEGWVLLDGVKR